MPVPTRRLALVAAALAVAIVLLPDAWPGIPETLPVGPWRLPGPVVVVNGLLLLLAGIDALLAGSPDAIEIEREAPAGIALAARGRMAWRLHNPTRARRTITVSDQLAPSLRADSRRFRTTLSPRGRGQVTTNFQPARRGDFSIDEIAVRLDGPLGLGARQKSRSVPANLRVLPAFPSREEADLRVNRARMQQVGLRSARALGRGSDFDQLREYGPDDEFRRIDWAATARSARPIVRTYRSERNQRVVCLLDNGRVMAGRVADAPRVEHAMDAVMTLTVVANGLGDRCGLVAFDRKVRAVVPPSAKKDQLGRITRELYALEPVLAESDYRTAFATTVSRFRRRAMLVVLTDLVVQAVEASLLPALPLIARNHLVLVGAVRDPEVMRWAAAPVDDAESAHRKAAALDVLADRERAIARLRGLGAVVVDAPPGELSTQLADAYLGFKASGRL